MQTLCVGENIKIVFDGQRISFVRTDTRPAGEKDLQEAEELLELFNMQVGGRA